MNKKQEKILVSLDIIELGLSIVGFITCCMAYALTNISQRYIFFLVAFILGINIISQIKKIEVRNQKPRIIKYSRKLIEQKSIRKVSF